MDIQNFLPFFGMCFIFSFSPGPSTILAGATGANFGLRKSMPLCVGAPLGYGSVIAFSIVVLSEATRLHTQIGGAIALVGGCILIWVAWKIATSGDGAFDLSAPGMRPLRVWESAAIQWINPKVWATSAALAAQVLSTEPAWNEKLIAVSTLIFLAFLACLCWSLAGTEIAGFLATSRRRKILNILLGLGLALVALPIILH